MKFTGKTLHKTMFKLQGCSIKKERSVGQGHCCKKWKQASKIIHVVQISMLKLAKKEVVLGKFQPILK